MSKTRRASARALVSRFSAVLAIVILASLASGLIGSVIAATPVTVGYRDDLQYGNPASPGGDDVTASRNQSKLWINDNFWFGVRFDQITAVAAKFRIWRFDMATQNWTNTGVAVDDRNRSHMDVLPDGNNVYVASSRAVGGPSTPPRDLRIYKYTYNTGSNTYAIVTGYPRIIPGTSGGTGFATIAKDASGDLWVAFTQANRIKIATSGDGGFAWSAPIDLPNQGNDIATTDIAAIASMAGGVGVLWSNQAATDDSFYFAAHLNGQPAATWQPRETAFGTVASAYDADGHISLKTEVSSGNLIAAIKTGRNDDPATNPGDPLIAVLKRAGTASAVGTWSIRTVSSVSQNATRPILVLDAAANEANVFMTHPTLASDGKQSIHRRTAPLSTLAFGAASIGTPFISSATELAINDPTSTKQMTTVTSGILVEATNIPTKHYLHNCVGGPCPVRPVANFTGTPTSGVRPLTVQFLDTSTGNPTSWSWGFGDGGISNLKNPSHTYTAAGTYAVILTATNPAGSDGESKTAYITVTNPAPPVANFTATPTSGTAPLTVQFTDTTTNAPTSWSWTFGDGGTSTVKNPSHVYANPGTYTVSLTATNGGGSDGETKTGYITVGQPPETAYFAITPKRVLDTRAGTGLVGPFLHGAPRQLNIAGANGIPTDAVAITGNLTVVGQTRAGYLSITRTSIANPSTSILNFPLSDTRANGVTVPLNTLGDVFIVYRGTAGARAHVILDVTGYFRNATTGTTYHSLTPRRVLDSRPGGTGLSGAFIANVPRTLSIAGANGIPGAAKAITGNLTVVGQTRAGYLSITPTPTANPSTSTLNFPLADTRANGVTVPLNSLNGDLSIVYKASSGSTHVILDVTGYFLDGLSGLTFVPVTPSRILDTRFGNGLSNPFAANVPRTWVVANRGGVGSDAIAVIGNVTVVNQTRAGYVSLTPSPQVNPTTSTINFPVGDVRANNFTVQLSGDNLSGVYKAPAGNRTALLMDVFGYYK